MTEQPLNLRESLAAIRRRWILVAVLGLLGLFGGIFYASSHSPLPTAEASILLPTPTATADGTPSTATKTATYIATSPVILTPAGQSLQTSPSARPGRASGPSHSRRRQHRPDRGSGSAVHAGPSPGERGGARYIQYSKENGLGVATVLSPATSVPNAQSTKSLILPGLMGLVVGSLVGTIAILIRARRDHRLRRRDEIAAAIGVPVLASLPADPRKSAADWVKLLESFEPPPTKAWSFNRILHSLVPDDFDSQLVIRVLSFAGDGPALAIGPELALFAADAGIPTRLAPDGHQSQEFLLMACASLRQAGYSGRLISFGTTEESWDHPLGRPTSWDDAPKPLEHQLIVSVVTIDRSHPVLTSFVGPTILAVSSGFAVRDDLARVALAATQDGFDINGIMVINPDPRDSSVGLVPRGSTASWAAYGNGSRHGNGPRVVKWPS